MKHGACENNCKRSKNVLDFSSISYTINITTKQGVIRNTQRGDLVLVTDQLQPERTKRVCYRAKSML